MACYTLSVQAYAHMESFYHTSNEYAQNDTALHRDLHVHSVYVWFSLALAL